MSARLPARRPGRSPKRRPTRWPAAFALAAAAGLALAACSSSSGSGSPAGSAGTSSAAGGATPAAVGKHSTKTLGEVFADTTGLTLYAADQEANGKISCTGGCLQFWHPVLATAAGTSSSGGSGGFGSVERPDTGKNQLTHAGRPVYTFAEDTAPGETKGNDVHDAFAGHQFSWHALTVKPATGTSTPPASTGPGSTGGSGSSGGGYGY